MTTVPEATDTFHYPWCDTSVCYATEAGEVGVEAGMMHMSRDRVWTWTKAPGGRVYRFCLMQWRATWSETELDLTVDGEWPDGMGLADLVEFVAFLRDVVHDTIYETTPVPSPAAPCPDWCTAATSDDAKIRREHEWLYGAPAGHGEYWRTHHGAVGRTWRQQSEHYDGSTRFGTRQVLGRVR